jgi:hypothetical protein
MIGGERHPGANDGEGEHRPGQSDQKASAKLSLGHGTALLLPRS